MVANAGFAVRTRGTWRAFVNRFDGCHELQCVSRALANIRERNFWIILIPFLSVPSDNQERKNDSQCKLEHSFKLVARDVHSKNDVALSYPGAIFFYQTDDST